MNCSTFFIAGTDTGVGKTRVTTGLLVAARTEGLTVAGMKPVAAGCDNDKLNDDVKKLRAATNVLTSLGQINPYSFLDPIAPHIAAHKAGDRASGAALASDAFFPFRDGLTLAAESGISAVML